MSHVPDPHRILAFAVYELRILLSAHIGPDSRAEAPVRAAAHLAYALHNQALAVLEGRTFDPAQAVEAIARVDQQFGENFVQQLSEAVERAP